MIRSFLLLGLIAWSGWLVGQKCEGLSFQCRMHEIFDKKTEKAEMTFFIEEDWSLKDLDFCIHNKIVANPVPDIKKSQDQVWDGKYIAEVFKAQNNETVTKVKNSSFDGQWESFINENLVYYLGQETRVLIDFDIRDDGGVDNYADAKDVAFILLKDNNDIAQLLKIDIKLQKAVLYYDFKELPNGYACTREDRTESGSLKDLDSLVNSFLSNSVVPSGLQAVPTNFQVSHPETLLDYLSKLIFLFDSVDLGLE